jgi:hypothetical protein
VRPEPTENHTYNRLAASRHCASAEKDPQLRENGLNVPLFNETAGKTCRRKRLKCREPHSRPALACRTTSCEMTGRSDAEQPKNVTRESQSFS